VRAFARGRSILSCVAKLFFPSSGFEKFRKSVLRVITRSTIR